MTLRFASSRAAPVLAAVLAVSCESSTLTPPNSPPPLHNTAPVIEIFEPLNTPFEAFVNDTIVFYVVARDADADALTTRFTVDGVAVSEEARWVYRIESAGESVVRVEVSDGLDSVAKTWEVRSFEAAGSPVNLTAVEPGGNPTTLDIAWLAGESLDGGPMPQYVVRSYSQPIDSGTRWALATAHAGVPASAQPGDTMSMTLSGLPGNAVVYVAVRGLDTHNRLTPLGNSLSAVVPGHALTGHVYGPAPQQPIAGAHVRFGPVETQTDASGAFAFVTVDGTQNLRVSDDDAPGIGQYYDAVIPDVCACAGDVTIHLLPNQPVVTTVYPDFLSLYISLTVVAGNPEGARTRRWQPPIRIYIPPFFAGDLDYAAAIAATIDDMDARLGGGRFVRVSAAPDTGVVVNYTAGPGPDYYVVVQWTPDNYPLRGVIAFRTHYRAATLPAFQQIIRHELGHVMGLNHSLDAGHLMIGSQAARVDFFTADELAVLDVYYRMPRGTDAGVWVRE